MHWVITDRTQESPHEHQQTLLLSRIINNIVRQLPYLEVHDANDAAGETEWVCDGDEQESSGIITPVFYLPALSRVHGSQLQDVNIQNMNVELVAQMFKNYQSNVLFHLEGMQ